MSSPKLNWQSYLHTRQAVGLVWQSSPGWTMASLALLLLLGLLPLASLYLMKLIVDATSTLKPQDFSFIARQKPMTIGYKDFYLDLLFYHRSLRRLVAIEFKLG